MVLVSGNSSAQELQVTVIKDSQTYPTGIIVTDAQLKALAIVRELFHGEWNSIIKSQTTPSL